MVDAPQSHNQVRTRPGSPIPIGRVLLRDDEQRRDKWAEKSRGLSEEQSLTLYSFLN